MRVSAAILIYNLYCNLYFHLSHINPCLCIGLLGTWLLHDDVLCYAYFAFNAFNSVGHLGK